LKGQSFAHVVDRLTQRGPVRLLSQNRAALEGDDREEEGSAWHICTTIFGHGRQTMRQKKDYSPRLCYANSRTVRKRTLPTRTPTLRYHNHQVFCL
jgi:hypothetical protein